jgi:hypothetical protein
MLRNVSRLNEQLPVPEDARGSIRAFCQAALVCLPCTPFQALLVIL